MPQDPGSSSYRSERLTLGHIMGAIAGLAIALAILPTPLSLAFAVRVLGILVLKGMHLPPVTRRDGVPSWLPWAFWALGLATRPVAIVTIGVL